MIPTNSIEIPSKTKIPKTAHTIPTKPSTRPIVARKSTKLPFTVLSFRFFSQDSKNNPGRSNEGNATETTHSDTTTTPRICPASSLALVANPYPAAPSAIPGISTETPPRRIPARAQASPIAERLRPTTVPPPLYSRDTSAAIFRRSPRLAHPPDQEYQADEGYQKTDELDAQEPHESGGFHAGEGVPQCVQDDGRREGSPDSPVKGRVTHFEPLPPQHRAHQPGPSCVSRR